MLRDRKRIVETFDNQQIKALFKACDLRTFVGLRDYTIMMLLLETGVRVNELVSIKTTDIIWEQKVIRIRNTKGGFERFVPIQDTLLYCHYDSEPYLGKSSYKNDVQTDISFSFGTSFITFITIFI
ncbi:hypothetical protein ETC01_06485 [Geobacillus sp. NFOSA3]|nr:hypothetical protein [Geobacillus sp. NFOSA3]